MAEHDLATPEGILAHFTDGPFACSEVQALQGGVGNFSFRLLLRTPYNGNKTVVVKHAKPYVAVAKGMPFDLERQRFEVMAMKCAKSALQPDTLVTVPDIYLHDEKANVIVMEDAADDPALGTVTTTLKELLLRTDTDHPPPMTEEAARTIGAALAEFIARWHAWGMEPEQAPLLDLFWKHRQAATIPAKMNYSRLQLTLAGEDPKAPACKDPPFGVSPADLEKVGTIGDEMRELMLTSRETLTMGDFWTGNILVKLGGGMKGDEAVTDVVRIYIVDWEFARPGYTGLEVGQLLAELHQASRFGTACQESAVALREAFLHTYKERMQCKTDMQKVARIALGHMGAHIVSWTPIVWAWGGKEKVREVVKEGLAFLLAAANHEALDTTPLGPLIANNSFS